MKRLLTLITVLILALCLAVSQDQLASSSFNDLAGQARAALAQTSGRVEVDGLSRPVEVLRDPWGIPHIYAETTDDLFFAQGFVAAQDRLWQMELWRRTGEGKLAEILGPSALERDTFARLMRYRGDMDAEWKSYAPDARRIIESFVRGVNAFIAISRDRLPIEFQVAGIQPEPWTPAVCLLRMAGYVMTGNARREIVRARLVHALGPDKAAQVLETDPPKKLEIPPGLDLSSIDERIVAAADSATAPIAFPSVEGSNNWVVDGTLTATGKPILANDPHRTIALPSLRYLVHLVGPGWNVIGAGEPALPGIAAGHNERVGFGFTIVGIDQQDMYVEETHPQDSARYRYKGQWEPMKVEREHIKVKGKAEPVEVELRFTRHGPVIYEDRERHRAYALRWVGTEPGTAGYLAALSLNHATNWQEFLSALERWKVPSENLIYADVDGNIGWQAAGLAPVRRGWAGFLPLSELPRSYNPPNHLIATANHKIIPEGYRHEIGFEWTAPFRFHRIDEVLRAGSRYTIADFERLQHDETSLPARELIPLLNEVKVNDPGLRPAVDFLLRWDQVVSKNSAAAALYEVWVSKLNANVFRPLVPADLWPLNISLATLIRHLKSPTSAIFGPSPQAKRDEIIVKSLAEALSDLRGRLGPDMATWRWGAFHLVSFTHPLSRDAATRAALDIPSVSRGGDGTTVKATGGPNFRQTSGASFREILDVSDWDNSVAINVPGQSGQPGSPHYADLLPLWADGKYVPLLFSRAKIEKQVEQRLILAPKRSNP